MSEAEALARIEALETKVAYQERTIEELNGALTEQWKQIDLLTKQVDRLLDRIKRVEETAPSSPADEPPPPHY
jgi:SlyX protein